VECPTGQQGLTRPTGTLKFPDFKRFIDQLTPSLSRLTLYFQGEPYLNRDLFDMISYARARKIFVWTSTNGHYLTEQNIRRTIEAGLNKLVIPVDGTDQAAYEQYRIGGSLETVLEGIRRFVRISREMKSRYPRLEIQFLVLKSNEHQKIEIKKLGNLLGMDRTVLKTAQFYDFEQGNALMPEAGKYCRYKRTGGQADKRAQGHRGTEAQSHQSRVTNPESRIPDSQFIIKNPMPDRCFRMWSGCVITWDGKVAPCCFDKDADHCLGDLNEQTFEEIWRGEKYSQFRQTILKNRKSVDICRNCSQRW